MSIYRRLKLWLEKSGGSPKVNDLNDGARRSASAASGASSSGQRPVTIYTTATCPYCIMAKRLLGARGIVFTEIPVGGNPELRQEMQAKGGGYTVPQIFIGDTPVGGSDELHALDARGALKEMLATG